MNINGKWYTEPQIEAYVTELEAKVAELEGKHWNECGQIAHYSDELRRANVLLRLALNDMDDEKDCGICEHNSDGQCPINKEGCKFEWTHAFEALALIGEDTNVGHKSSKTSTTTRS